MIRPMHAHIVRCNLAISSPKHHIQRHLTRQLRLFASQQHQKNVSNESGYNFYSIRDSREKTVAKGFDKDDPRATWTNKDDVTLDVDIDNFGEDEELLNDKFPRLAGLNVRPRVDFTNVCKSIKALDHHEIVAALYSCIPHYSNYKSVKDLYLYIKSNDRTKPKVDSATRLKLTALKVQVGNLSKVQTFGLQESLLTLLIFNDLKLLDYEMAKAFSQSVQWQLYAFRPFDVAAAITVFGQFPGGFNPLINVLGMVFYDMLIGGKTSICANGVTSEELLAVACALRDTKREIKKVTDAIFGSIYKRINEFATPMLVTALDSFFTIAKSHNFVEFYTIVLARALDYPLLFIDRFQEHVQEQLSVNFDIPSASCKLLQCNQSLDPVSVPKLLRALANCESEFLISSVHWRIEFKRLWSENIKSGNLAWQPTAKEKEYKYPPLTGSDKMVTYKSLMPSLYESIQKLILNYILGPNILTCGNVAKRIVEVNSKVVECCLGILERSDINTANSDVQVDKLLETYYPLLTNIRRIVTFEHEDVPGAEDLVNDNLEALPMVTYDSSEIHAKLEPLNGDVIKLNAEIALTRYGFKSCIDNVPNYMAWLTEFKSETAMGMETTLDYKSHATFLHLAHCIKFVSDYSRYTCSDTDEAYGRNTKPVEDVLANLYHRLLFYIPPTSTPIKLENATIETLKYISPTALFLEYKHLPFVTSTYNFIGHEEYINLSDDTINCHYYKPNPVFASLYKGSGYLYGILCYTIANRMQYLSIKRAPWLQEYNLPLAIQNLLHPIYCFTRLECDHIEIWSLVYYCGDYVNVTKYLDGGASLNGIQAKTHKAMTKALSNSIFQHLFVVFINTASNIIHEIQTFVGVDTRLDYIRALVMLQHCVCYIRQHLGVVVGNVIHGDNLFQKIIVPTDEVEAVSFKVSEHINLIETIAMSIDFLNDKDQVYKLLHQSLLLAYKRQQYFTFDYLIRYSSALACLEKHFGAIELTEYLENVSQLSSMLKRDAMQAIAKYEPQIEGDAHVGEPAKRYLLHVLSSCNAN